jgi:hypothetical protein
MSYSRWGDSTWYCFWASTQSEKLEDQLLSLWHSIDVNYEWTYAQLENITMDQLQRSYPMATLYEIEEAMGYIRQFLGEARNEYGPK